MIQMLGQVTNLIMPKFIAGAGQDENQGDIRYRDSPLDGQPPQMYRKHRKREIEDGFQTQHHRHGRRGLHRKPRGASFRLASTPGKTVAKSFLQ